MAEWPSGEPRLSPVGCYTHLTTKPPTTTETTTTSQPPTPITTNAASSTTPETTTTSQPLTSTTTTTTPPTTTVTTTTTLPPTTTTATTTVSTTAETTTQPPTPNSSTTTPSTTPETTTTTLPPTTTTVTTKPPTTTETTTTSQPPTPISTNAASSTTPETTTTTLPPTTTTTTTTISTTAETTTQPPTTTSSTTTPSTTPETTTTTQPPSTTTTTTLTTKPPTTTETTTTSQPPTPIATNAASSTTPETTTTSQPPTTTTVTTKPATTTETTTTSQPPTPITTNAASSTTPETTTTSQPLTSTTTTTTPPTTTVTTTKTLPPTTTTATTTVSTTAETTTQPPTPTSSTTTPSTTPETTTTTLPPTTTTVTTKPPTTTETTTTSQPPTPITTNAASSTTPETTTTSQPLTSTTTTTTPPTTPETTTTTLPPTTTTTTTTISTTAETTTQPPTTTSSTTTPSTTPETTTTTQPPSTTTTNTAPPTTPETTTTSQPLTSTTTTTTPPTTTVTTTMSQPSTSPPCTCYWSEWINLGKPTPGPNGGEHESITQIKSAVHHACLTPEEVKCRAVLYPGLSMSEVGQVVTCNKDVGLKCENKQQGLQQECFDYEIKFKCCTCQTLSTPSTTTTKTPTTTSTTQPPTTTTTTTTTISTTAETTTQPPTTTSSTATPSTVTEKTTTTLQPTTTTVTTKPPTTTETTTTSQSPTPISTNAASSTTPETTTTTLPPTTTTTTTTTVSTTAETSTQPPTTTSSTTTPSTTPETTTTTQPPSTTTTNTAAPTTPETTTTTLPPTTTTTTTTVSTTAETTTQPPTTTSSTTTPSTTPETTTTTQPPSTTTTNTAPPTTPETTTTSQPLTSTTTTTTPPTTTVTTTMSQPSTSPPCTCYWSEWINLGKPTPGPNGGEHESITQIKSAVHHACLTPEEVKCRAVLYPGLSMSEVGQVVTCNKDVGLICENKQQGLQQECFDYEIKFKCCWCQTLSTPSTTTIKRTSTTSFTSPVTTTETATSTWPPTTSTTTTTPSVTPETATKTQPTTATSTTNIFTTINVMTGGTSQPRTANHNCHCFHNGTEFLPNSIVYNVTDHDGYCYTGYCNENCNVVPKHHPCSMSKKDCVDITPPRKDGESWNASNCRVGTCHTGMVTYSNKKCPTLKPKVCVNNFPPIEVKDSDECCSHYECQCICYGWGDPNYVTFDGTFYSFKGNCSYWLVKEILPKQNFSIIIDNYYCGAADGLSCPKSITVFYKSYKIFITQNKIKGILKNQVFVNDKPIKSPAYQNDDFRLTNTDIDAILVIPKIHARVTYSGLLFSIYLPYSIFHGNTEGQCGTCDNNRTEDCRLPSGKIDPSCSNMAPFWHLNNSLCHNTPPLPPKTNNTCDSTICEIIKSSVFEACHNLIDNSRYFNVCESDVCHKHNANTGCHSLKSYADACAEAGVCIPWRNATNGVCEYQCPTPKVYHACGPQVVPTCDSWYNEKFIYTGSQFSAMTKEKLEGCYCPNDTILLSSSSNECVSTCEICRLANGKWTKANASWIEGCEECICEEDTLQVTCHNISCPTQSPLSCDHEGQVKVNDTVGCCQKEKCECDVKGCSHIVPSCPPGSTLSTETGVCCHTYTCVNTCVFNNTGYKVGDMVPMNPCEKCTCTNTTEAGRHQYEIKCLPVPCDTHCPLGYEYQSIPGQCCGKCVQTSCIVMLSKNSTHMLKPGTVWSPAGNPCEKFECVKTANQFITVEAKIICQPFNPDECIPGTEAIAPDGCCRVCVPNTHTCSVSTTAVYLESKGCYSKDTVNITSCSGACGTFTFYSSKMRSLQHTCSCCQEMATSERQIQLSCPNNTEVSYTYIHIDACGCLKTKCSAFDQSDMATTPSSIKSRRRRR
ncbi:mucin-2-like [Xiphias gladius]|uniref:mucin-2-like n=1 Tax=Xiphias gladius TaxID=8245 RepID=UPI001A9999C0|nr:mucin-2-like [Xiphias gladius]